MQAFIRRSPLRTHRLPIALRILLAPPGVTFDPRRRIEVDVLSGKLLYFTTWTRREIAEAQVRLLVISGIFQPSGIGKRSQRNGKLQAVAFAKQRFGFRCDFALERRQVMFGKMNVIQVLDLRNGADQVANGLDGAVARLLDVTDHPRIEKFVQLPKALFVFLIVPGDPESGAFYVYDRCSRVWYWVDFDDEKFGGYSVGDFERLVRECRFLDIVERPNLLVDKDGWIVEPGSETSATRSNCRNRRDLRRFHRERMPSRRPSMVCSGCRRHSTQP